MAHKFRSGRVNKSMPRSWALIFPFSAPMWGPYFLPCMRLTNHDDGNSLRERGEGGNPSLLAIPFTGETPAKWQAIYTDYTRTACPGAQRETAFAKKEKKKGTTRREALRQTGPR